MTIHFAAAPADDVLLAQRPLTETELHTIRERIHGPANNAFHLTDTVVEAVFDALLTGSGHTYREVERLGGEHFDRNRYAIPISQWTAIAMTVTDRAYEWGTAASAGMDLAALMPAGYDDPDVPTPHLAAPDERPYIWRLDIGREAAATISACYVRLQALAEAYGADSAHYRDALISWTQQLTGLLTALPGRHQVVHPDGPLSLYISTDDGHHYGIAFQPTARRCTVAGCHAIAAATSTEPRWQPTVAATLVLDHEHQPNYPLDGPHPGTWVTRL
jgi:hypothetical protein